MVLTVYPLPALLNAVPDLICDSEPDCPEQTGISASFNNISSHQRIQMSYSSVLNYKPSKSHSRPPSIQVTPPYPTYCTYCQRRRRMFETKMTGSDSQKMDVFQGSDSNPALTNNCTCYMNRQLMRRDSYIHHIRTPRSAPHITFMQ